MTTYDPSNLWHNTALHESAHTVMALYLGRPVEYVKLWAEPRATPDGPGWFVAGETAWHTGNASPQHRILLVLAGHAARSLVDPDPRFNRFDVKQFAQEQPRDFEAVQAALTELPNVTPKRRRRILAESWQQSRKILETRWPHVVALANELITLHQTTARSQTTPAPIETVIWAPDPCALAARRA